MVNITTLKTKRVPNVTPMPRERWPDVSRVTNPDYVSQWRPPAQFRPEAVALSNAIDEMSGDDWMALPGMAAGWAWDKAKGAAGTIADAATQPADWGDVLKGTASGLRSAGEGIASLPGNAYDLGWTLRDTLAMQMGMSPEAMAQFDRLMKYNPHMMALRNAPTSETVEGTTEGWLPHYQAKTPLGQIGQFVGEQADPSVLLPGGAAVKWARRAF